MKSWTTKHGITVYRLDTNRCSCYAIVTEQERWLIDTSTQYNKERIVKQLEACNISELTGIILTHSHINHVESVAWFAQKYHCPVFVHDSELHFVQTGDCMIPKASASGIAWIGSVVSLIPGLNKYPPCREAKAIDFNEPLIWSEFIKIIETPGHSEGCISIIIDDEIAIVGDLMRRRVFQIKLFWADQPGLIEVSWKKVLQEKCTLFLPSHGAEISRKLVEEMIQ